MQNNQNKNKRNFYTDVALQQELATKLAEKLNSFLPDDQKITKEEIENLGKELPNKLKRKEKMDDLAKIFQEKSDIKEKYEKEHNVTPDFGRSLPLLLITDSNVKDDANNMVLDQAYSKNGKKYVEKAIMNDIMNFDMTKIVAPSDDPDTVIEHFEKYETGIRAMWAIDSMLDHNTVNPENKEFLKIYNENLNLFQTASYTQNMAVKATCPFSFITPERLFKFHDQQVNLMMSEFTKGLLEEYRNVLDDSISFDENGKYTKYPEDMAALLQTDASDKEAQFLREEINNYNITKDFLSKSHYQIDGKDATMKEVFEAVKSGNKEIECVDYPEDVKVKNENCLDYAFLDEEQTRARIAHDNKVKEEQNFDKQAKEFGKTLASLNKQMKKTHYIFSRDTDEFKKMDKQLDKFTKMFYHANPDLAKEVGYKLDKNFAQKNDISKESLLREYKELKEKLSDYYEKKAEIKNNSKDKKLNDRGEKRLAATIDTFKKITGEKIERYQSVKKTEKQKAKYKEEAAKAEKALNEKVNINSRPELKAKLDANLKTNEGKTVVSKQEQAKEKTVEISNDK